MSRRSARLRILVNNAGIYESKAFQDITDEDWLRLFEVNVMSGVRLSRAFLPPMLLLNWGRMIFVSSESAINIPKEMIHYGMTKTAQLAISRGLAELTKGTQVTVNTVAPGPTASEGVIDFVKGVAASQGKDQEAIEGEFFKTVRPTSLLQRSEDPMEIAQSHRVQWQVRSRAPLMGTNPCEQTAALSNQLFKAGSIVSKQRHEHRQSRKALAPIRDLKK